MTQIIVQIKYFLSLINKFSIAVFNSFIEARQKQANFEIAKQLQYNNDFKNFSYYEILKILETKRN
jgi:hypothetical protein